MENVRFLWEHSDKGTSPVWFRVCLASGLDTHEYESRGARCARAWGGRRFNQPGPFDGRAVIAP